MASLKSVEMDVLQAVREVAGTYQNYEENFNDEKYAEISSPLVLYDMLSEIWCRYTCAPRLREKWSPDNITLGQCSITAFLAQDIFGGSVLGLLRSGGNYHCYNKVGDVVFDLTSEQFGDEKLDYSLLYEQTREEHFQKAEKEARYEVLKAKLSAQFRIQN